MTDDTQELDEILNKAIVASTSPVPLSLNNEAVVEVRLRYQDLTKQAILDWHNKQIEAVLNELDSCRDTHSVDTGCDDEVLFIPYSALETERNKLKESSSDKDS